MYAVFPFALIPTIVLFAVTLLSACSGLPKSTAGDLPAVNVSSQITPPRVTLHATRHERSGSGSQNPASGSAALDYFNAKRWELGLPVLERGSVLDASARAHARYLLINHESGHTETAGRPAYMGQDPAARIDHALSLGGGSSKPPSPEGERRSWSTGESEVLSVYGQHYNDTQAVRQLFDAPYHRGVILFDWLAAGEALTFDAPGSSPRILVVDFAILRPILPDTELLAYPYDGERNVPAAWVDNEDPDPLENAPGGSAYYGRRVGYPITLSGGPNSQIDWRRVELRDVSGHYVNCVLAQRTGAQSSRTTPGSTAVCTPIRALRTGTVYSVHALGTVRVSRFVTAPFDLSWTFQTAE